MTVDGEVLYFFYDGSGKPLCFVYNGDKYYYATNLQGDVVGIVNAAGNTRVKYTYDAWGNILSITGSYADTIGKLNPLRYRGYVYDQPTQLYYLQSRYYAPNLGRFLNADAFASTGQGLLGYNMFAYCLNNPVMYHDPSGDIAVVDDVLVFAFFSAVALVCVIAVMVSPPMQQITYNGMNQLVSDVRNGYEQLEEQALYAKAKGKENVRDTGLAQETDEEIQRKAHDNSLSKAERERYRREEKGRGLRNKQKRRAIYK